MFGGDDEAKFFRLRLHVAAIKFAAVKRACIKSPFHELSKA